MLTGTLKNKVTSYLFPLQGDDARYQLIRITGLSPVPATVNLSTVAGMDGARYNSSRVDTRNIVIYLKLNDAAAVRKTLEDNFPTGAQVELTINNGTVEAKTNGYIDTFECDAFSDSETAQISIICPDPRFYALTPTTVTVVQDDAFINTNSNLEIGALIRIKRLGEPAGRESTIAITRANDAKTITVKYSFGSNDIIEINTAKGQRSVILIDGTTGERRNIFGALQQGSEFWLLRGNSNLIICTIDGFPIVSSAFETTIKYTIQYAGM